MNFARLLLLMAIAVSCIIGFGDVATRIAELMLQYFPSLPLKEPIHLIFTIAMFFALSRYLNIHKDNQMPLGTIERVCFSVILAIILVGACFILLSALGFIKQNTMEPYGILEIMFGSIFMIMHGASEQLISQGIVHVYARQYWEKWAGLIAATLCFAFTQFLQGFDAPILIINNLIMGGFFAIIAMRFGLLGAVFAHGTWTWFEVLVLGRVFGLELKPMPPLFIDSDSYGTIVLTFVGLILCFLLLFFGQNGYKPAHDKAKH